MKPRVAIFFTGGTIAMKVDEARGGAVPALRGADLVRSTPGLEEVAETGVMLHADLTSDLLRTTFAPRTPLHDGAVIIRDDSILAAGALLPLAEMTVHTERFGTRHRAALGITEQTDAVVIVVSEENSQISVVERARIVRNLSEAQLAKSIRTLLAPDRDRSRLGRRLVGGTPGGRAPRLTDLGRFVPSRGGRNGGHHGDGASRAEAAPRAAALADDDAAAAQTPR